MARWRWSNIMAESKVAMPETEEKPAVAEPQTKSPVRIVVAILLVIAIGAGLWAYYHYRDRVSTDDAEVDGHVSAIAPKISGNVIDVLVRDNQPVKAGDVLVRIDPRDYQARVDQAKATLAEDESKLRAAQVGVPLSDLVTESGETSASAGVGDAQAELDRARLVYEQASSSDLAFAEANVHARQANNDRAQADLARMKPLVDKAEISQQQYDAYVAAAKVADSELKAAQEKLASAGKDAAIKKASLAAAETRVAQANAQLSTSVANRKQVAIRTADAGTAQAVVESARATLEAAELQLSYATIIAPMDGVVTRKSVLKMLQRFDDGAISCPTPCGTARSSVHNKVVRTLGDLSIEVVHEHAHGSFLLPAFAGDGVAARRTNRRRGLSFGFNGHA